MKNWQGYLLVMKNVQIRYFLAPNLHILEALYGKAFSPPLKNVLFFICC